MSNVFDQLKDQIYRGEVDEVQKTVEKFLADGSSASEILSHGLITGMDTVGRDFRDGALFIPEVLLSAKTMHAGLEILRPYLAESEVSSRGKIVIGTVAGDMHDIGKNLVSMMLEGAGFNIVDLGVDVSPEQFVEAVRNEKPEIVGMSALLTTTMPAMKATIRALADENLIGDVKVIVGGAPVTEDFAKMIEADGYAPDAAAAIDLARSIIS